MDTNNPDLLLEDRPRSGRQQHLFGPQGESTDLALMVDALAQEERSPWDADRIRNALVLEAGVDPATLFDGTGHGDDQGRKSELYHPENGRADARRWQRDNGACRRLCGGEQSLFGNGRCRYDGLYQRQRCQDKWQLQTGRNLYGR